MKRKLGRGSRFKNVRFISEESFTIIIGYVYIFVQTQTHNFFFLAQHVVSKYQTCCRAGELFFFSKV